MAASLPSRYAIMPRWLNSFVEPPLSTLAQIFGELSSLNRHFLPLHLVRLLTLHFLLNRLLHHFLLYLLRLNLTPHLPLLADTLLSYSSFPSVLLRDPVI